MIQIDKMIEWIMQDPKTRIGIIVALIGFIGVIIGSLFTTIIWPSLKALFIILYGKLVSKMSKRNFENRYLDWVIKEHQYLPILPTTLVPITEKNIHELDKLYVSLSFTKGTESETEIELCDGLRENRSLVILGDPGAGKTTLLRYLALNLSRARRKIATTDPNDVENTLRQKYKIDRGKIQKEVGYNDFPLPIFVYLNRYNDIESWPKGRSLLDVLRDELRTVDILRDFPKEFFNEKLKRGECVFLFDAFDELGASGARNAVSKHIGRLANSTPQGNRFVVTSRIVGYNGQLFESGFKTIIINSLSWELTRKLIVKWYDSLGEVKLANQLLNTLKSNHRILELAVNPMLLSLIVLVQYIRRLIPDKRHILYKECVNILVERRYASVQVQKEYNQILPSEDAIIILQELALIMHNNRIREISRYDLEDKLIPNIQEMMVNSIAANRSPDEILENIEKRSQLLVERGYNESGQPVIAFSHLTFQEYLASYSLIKLTRQNGEKAVSSTLISNYEEDPEWWEEVGLLYSAQLEGLSKEKFLKRLYPS